MAEPAGLRSKGNRRSRRLRRLLIAAIAGVPTGDLRTLSQAVRRDRRLAILGIVPVRSPRSLSQAAADARQLRSELRREYAQSDIRVRPKILVSHDPDLELAAELAQLNADLLLQPWLADSDPLQRHLEAMLSHATVDVLALNGPLPPPGSKILAVLRAGHDSELALRLTLDLAAHLDLEITTLRHADDTESVRAGETTEGLALVLEHLPQVEDALLLTDDPVGAILEESASFDLVALGASGHPVNLEEPIDPFCRRLAAELPAPFLLARAQPQLPLHALDAVPGSGAISILVDKWFAENTFHADEFHDLKDLLKRKEAQGLTISLALPSLNEEETVGNVIRTVKRTLQKEVPLLDEIVLMDSNSSDRTREIAADLGIPVHIHQQVLPQYGAREGKGEALWKSLYITRGDLILWIDTDIVNIHPRFIYGLIGPLINRRELMFIKGYYLRPVRVGDTIQAGGGGRVTELTARPLINLFYPALSGLIQPLSGEYGGRREALEKLPFSSGYGVEIGLLIDLLEQFGLSAIGQVDLIKRIHHNQPLTALSMMSSAIIQTVTRKLDRSHDMELLKDVNLSMKIVRNLRSRFFLEVERIAELERPPMITLPEYQARTPPER